MQLEAIQTSERMLSVSGELETREPATSTL